VPEKISGEKHEAHVIILLGDANMEERVGLSIVVPIFNEQDVVEELHQRLKSVLENTRLSYEMVFVDDGSSDRSFQKLLAIKDSDPSMKLIKLRGNFGQTPALAAGFDFADGDIIISMDGDLQHLPEDIPVFIDKIHQGYDIVSGWRKERKDPFISRRLPSKIANFLMRKTSGVDLRDFGTTFKAYKREIIKEIHLYSQFHRFIPTLASSMKVRIAEIPIENVKQKHRKSHYNITRTFTVFFDLIRLNFLNKFVERPLQLFGTVGFLMLVAGSGITTYLVYLKFAFGLPLFEYRAPMLVFSLLLIVLGVMFISLGLLGEMLVKFFYGEGKIKIYNIEEIYK